MNTRPIEVAGSTSAVQPSSRKRGISLALPTLASALALSIGISAAQAQVAGTYSLAADPNNQAVAMGGNQYDLSSGATTYSFVNFTPNITLVGDQVSTLAANFTND